MSLWGFFGPDMPSVWFGFQGCWLGAKCKEKANRQHLESKSKLNKPTKWELSSRTTTAASNNAARKVEKINYTKLNEETKMEIWSHWMGFSLFFSLTRLNFPFNVNSTQKKAKNNRDLIHCAAVRHCRRVEGDEIQLANDNLIENGRKKVYSFLIRLSRRSRSHRQWWDLSKSHELSTAKESAKEVADMTTIQLDNKQLSPITPEVNDE